MGDYTTKIKVHFTKYYTIMIQYKKVNYISYLCNIVNAPMAHKTSILPIFKGIHQGSDSMTSICKARVTTGMKEYFMFCHGSTKQCYNIVYT